MFAERGMLKCNIPRSPWSCRNPANSDRDAVNGIQDGILEAESCEGNIQNIKYSKISRISPKSFATHGAQKISKLQWDSSWILLSSSGMDSGSRNCKAETWGVQLFILEGKCMVTLPFGWSLNSKWMHQSGARQCLTNKDKFDLFLKCILFFKFFSFFFFRKRPKEKAEISKNHNFERCGFLQKVKIESISTWAALPTARIPYKAECHTVKGHSQSHTAPQINLIYPDWAGKCWGCWERDDAKPILQCSPSPKGFTQIKTQPLDPTDEGWHHQDLWEWENAAWEGSQQRFWLFSCTKTPFSLYLIPSCPAQTWLHVLKEILWLAGVFQGFQIPIWAALPLRAQASSGNKKKDKSHRFGNKYQ